MRFILLAFVLVFYLAANGVAQFVGTVPRPWQVENFRGVETKNTDDFRGRLVLYEFFTYT